MGRTCQNMSSSCYICIGIEPARLVRKSSNRRTASRSSTPAVLLGCRSQGPGALGILCLDTSWMQWRESVWRPVRLPAERGVPQRKTLMQREIVSRPSSRRRSLLERRKGRKHASSLDGALSYSHGMGTQRNVDGTSQNQKGDLNKYNMQLFVNLKGNQNWIAAHVPKTSPNTSIVISSHRCLWSIIRA